jgi:regulator of nonsense transcripts 2
MVIQITSNIDTAGGTPRVEVLNSLDMPDDYFRIRLVCSLLDSCGMCFDRGSAKKKLDFFLSFFQYYVFTKETLPMDVEFLVQDCYAIVRPSWKIAATLEEAGQTFAQAVKQNYKIDPAEIAQEQEDLESSESSAGEEDLDLPEEDEDEAHVSSEKGDEETSDIASDSDEEQIIVKRQEFVIDPEEEADFDRELAKLTAESLDSRKFERKPVFDVPLPMRKRVDRQTRSDSDSDGEPEPEQTIPVPVNTMAFSLLTKRGNRQQTRTVELPSDSTFALAMKTQQEAERSEQQRIKQLVLDYEQRDDKDIDPAYYNAAANNSGGGSGIGPNSHNIAASTSGSTSVAGAGPLNQPLRGPNRTDKAGSGRNSQRARKLQLSDVNW